jgi:DNA invertase Pin-like site-specific DNA recombinase
MPTARRSTAGRSHGGKFVAYYRVSTAKQGQSGLGLEAQRAAVLAYLNGGNWQLVAEHTEVESGKDNDRPALASALHDCRLMGARLIIAKLDRLSRNAAFLLSLADSGVDFVCADMPEANRLTIGLLAVVAQHEREMISQRTKDALAAAKARGVKLGGIRPNHRDPDPAIGTAAAARYAATFAARVSPLVNELQASGMSLGKIAAELTERGVQTQRGGAWTAASVRNVLLRYQDDRLTAHGVPAPAPIMPWNAYRPPGAPRE